MFMGKHSHTVDAKGRMIVPSVFREELGDSFVITRGLDACLTIYPKAAWQKMAERLQSLSTTRKEVRALIRFLIGGSNEVEYDKQGRILIPAHLREYAHIKRDAIVIGTGDRIEVWSKEEYAAYENEQVEDISEIAESLELPIDFSI